MKNLTSVFKICKTVFWKCQHIPFLPCFSPTAAKTPVLTSSRFCGILILQVFPIRPVAAGRFNYCRGCGPEQ